MKKPASAMKKKILMANQQEYDNNNEASWRQA